MNASRVVDEGGIVAADGAGRVEQRRQQVFLDIADVGGVLLQAVKDVLDVGGRDAQQLLLHHLSRVLVSGNHDGFLTGAEGFRNEVHHLVKLLSVLLRVLHENVVLDILFDDLSRFLVSHPVISRALQGGWGIDWIRI